MNEDDTRTAGLFEVELRPGEGVDVLCKDGVGGYNRYAIRTTGIGTLVLTHEGAAGAAIPNPGELAAPSRA